MSRVREHAEKAAARALRMLSAGPGQVDAEALGETIDLAMDEAARERLSVLLGAAPLVVSGPILTLQQAKGRSPCADLQSVSAPSVSALKFDLCILLNAAHPPSMLLSLSHRKSIRRRRFAVALGDNPKR